MPLLRLHFRDLFSVFLVSLLLGQLWIASIVPDVVVTNNNLGVLSTPLDLSQTSAIVTQKHTKYLIYLANGQGTGNLMSGLLAAHALGVRWNRTVCVSTTYRNFHLAFDTTDKNCNKQLLQMQEQHNKPNKSNTLEFFNYRKPSSSSSSCSSIMNIMNTTNYVLYFRGNTYPYGAWPQPETKSLHFNTFYQPTFDLQRTIPWKTKPSIVVHLRQGDGSLDERNGLDNNTLHALEQHISSSLKSHVIGTEPTVFLVTNQIQFYDYFMRWNHPPWNGVIHSAMPRINWGFAHKPNESQEADIHTYSRQDFTIISQQYNRYILQMWSDWYTLLCAKQVYHTFSGFSTSAIHWNQPNVQGWTIIGYSNETAAVILRQDLFQNATNCDSDDNDQHEAQHCRNNLFLIDHRCTHSIITTNHDPIRNFEKTKLVKLLQRRDAKLNLL